MFHTHDSKNCVTPDSSSIYIDGVTILFCIRRVEREQKENKKEYEESMH